MAEPSGIEVEVCHAGPDGVWRRRVRLPVPASVAQALAAAGVAQAFPAIDPETQGVGVYGQRVGLESVLAEGDRVEIYRPLCFDPMTSRRRRAAHKARQARLQAVRA